jgi:hypothetical protein
MNKPLLADELMMARLDERMARCPPTLDEILGSACEVYRVNPDDLLRRHAAPARHAYCYLAVRWSGEATRDIGLEVGFSELGVDKAYKTYARRLNLHPLMRDDIDLIGIRVLERVLMRRRVA